MIIATVLTGTKYSVYDVIRIYNMLDKFSYFKYEPVCITDKPEVIRKHDKRIRPVKVENYLHTWWAKMRLFDTGWRGREPVIYFDLDTLICGNLYPLIKLQTEFAICSNFTKKIKPNYPCSYGSCIMKIGPDFGDELWTKFKSGYRAYMTERYGDQKAIEFLYPKATLLQDCLPDQFILGYRDVKGLKTKPIDTSLVAYAGGRSPLTMGPDWAKEIWKES